MTLLAQNIYDKIRFDLYEFISSQTSIYVEVDSIRLIDQILKERNRILKEEKNSEYSRGIHQAARYVMVKGKRVKIQDADND